MAGAGKNKKGYSLGKDPVSQLQLHLLMLPGTLLILMFSIVPLFGLILAFKNYQVTEGIKGVFTSPFYGLQNFKIIFANHDFGRMLVNTLGINLIGQLVTIPVTILFALFINEIANQKIRSLVQTVTYMPHFISWVVFGGIMITLLGGGRRYGEHDSDEAGTDGPAYCIYGGTRLFLDGCYSVQSD